MKHWKELTRNDQILIIGASGGCGSLGVQIAKSYGCKVYGVCSQRNLNYVKELGCDVVIDYTKTNFLDDFKQEKFDLIYDTVTSPEDGNQEEIFKHLLKPEGKYVAINGEKLNFFKGFLSNLGLKIERKNYHLTLLTWNTVDLEYLKFLVESNKVKPLAFEKFTLNDENIKKAFDKLKTRRTVGKLVFEINV